MDSLKALDPRRPIREADLAERLIVILTFAAGYLLNRWETRRDPFGAPNAANVPTGEGNQARRRGLD